MTEILLYLSIANVILAAVNRDLSGICGWLMATILICEKMHIFFN
jgi:hypothetical protein